MPCCGKRRAILASQPSSAPRGVTARGVTAAPRPGRSGVAGPGADRAGVPVRFVGTRRVRVEGTVSGRIYQASPGDRPLTADPEDLRGLLRSGLFVVAQPA
jgi:hypothetical protein